MARPIRETPILIGKNAERFVEHMKFVEGMSEEQRKINRDVAQAAYNSLITEVEY